MLSFGLMHARHLTGFQWPLSLQFELQLRMPFFTTLNHQKASGGYCRIFLRQETKSEGWHGSLHTHLFNSVSCHIFFYFLCHILKVILKRFILKKSHFVFNIGPLPIHYWNYNHGLMESHHVPCQHL